MFLPRIIPVLLLQGKGLVKTQKFKNAKYIGDPINAVRIFNDLKADELVFLDIEVSKKGSTISKELVKDIGDEAYMPIGVGGGVKKISEVEELLKAGAEKIIINTQFVLNPTLISQSALHFGSQSIVVSIDIKKNIIKNNQVYIKGGTKKVKHNFLNLAQQAEDLGAGELLINSIDLDGAMNGYNIDLIRSVSDIVSIPVVACGGAGNLMHLKEAYVRGNAHAMAAGSMFVFHGPRKAVLINYPSKIEMLEIFKDTFDNDD